MRGRLRTALLALVLLMIVATIVVYLQPDSYTVVRSAMMASPPAEVFRRVDDLRSWDAWSPWKSLDPKAKVTYSGPSSGVGASFSWSGNGRIGEGTLTIRESFPDKLIELEQVFVRPLAGKARMRFTFAPEERGTLVTWRMEGTNGFVGKAICLFMSMDRVVGEKFSQGLANLKAEVEKRGAAPPGPQPVSFPTSDGGLVFGEIIGVGAETTGDFRRE